MPGCASHMVGPTLPAGSGLLSSTLRGTTQVTLLQTHAWGREKKELATQAPALSPAADEPIGFNPVLQNI